MNIDPLSTFAGIPAMDARDFMRDNRDGFSKENVESAFGDKAQGFIDLLLELEGVEPDRDRDGYFLLLEGGNAIANASAAKPYKRATAQRAFDAFLTRVDQINADENALYAVKRVILFGSFLDESRETVSDVDLLVETVAKRPLTKEENDLMFQRFIERRPRGDGPMFDLDVLRYLKGRSPVIGLGQLDEHQDKWLADKSIPHKLVWQDESVK